MEGLYIEHLTALGALDDHLALEDGAAGPAPILNYSSGSILPNPFKPIFEANGWLL